MGGFVGPVDPDVPAWADDLRGTLPMPPHRRAVDRIRHVVVHRAGGGDWPQVTEDLVRELMPHWPGAGVPYWAFVEPTGRVAVVSHLKSKGAHAAKYNSSGLGIAVIGDFRKHAPTHVQRVALLRLLQWCCDRFERGVDIVTGHTELPEASNSASKVCPGPLLGMDAVRFDLAAGQGFGR